MKIRNGFVSNSSTSSFALFGVEIESVGELYQKCTSMPSKINKDDETDDEYFEKLDEMVESIENNLAEKKSLLCLTQTNSSEYVLENSYVLGIDLESINPNKDPVKVLSEVQKEIEALFGKKMKPGFHCGVIENG